MGLRKISKTILLVFLIALLSSICFPIEKGVKGGICISPYRFSEWESGKDAGYHDKEGSSICFFVGIPLSKILFFQPEIIVSQKGAQVKKKCFSTVPPVTEMHNWEYYYVELPLLLKFYPWPENPMKVMFYGGGSASILLGSTYRYIGPRYGIELDDKLKRFDYGLVVGSGFAFRMSDGVDLVLDLRYYAGFANVAHESNQTYPNIRSSTIYLLLGVQF